jgi:hypothetical protein
MIPEEAQMLKPGDRLREGRYTFWKVQAVTAQGVELWSAGWKSTRFVFWADPYLGVLVQFHKGSEGKPWWERLQDPD